MRNEYCLVYIEYLYDIHIHINLAVRAVCCYPYTIQYIHTHYVL